LARSRNSMETLFALETLETISANNRSPHERAAYPTLTAFGGYIDPYRGDPSTKPFGTGSLLEVIIPVLHGFVNGSGAKHREGARPAMPHDLAWVTSPLANQARRPARMPLVAAEPPSHQSQAERLHHILPTSNFLDDDFSDCRDQRHVVVGVIT
jgi:hypothetical protein